LREFKSRNYILDQLIVYYNDNLSTAEVRRNESENDPELCIRREYKYTIPAEPT
jgi:hypothetical protein